VITYHEHIYFTCSESYVYVKYFICPYLHTPFNRNDIKVYFSLSLMFVNTFSSNFIQKVIVKLQIVKLHLKMYLSLTYCVKKHCI